MVLVSPAIRLRLYARFGLSIGDIARVCFISGLTFWLGNIAALGIGMAYRPDAARAVDQIPAWGNQAIGIAALGVVAACFIWLWGKTRHLGRRGSGVTLAAGAVPLP